VHSALLQSAEGNTAAVWLFSVTGTSN